MGRISQIGLASIPKQKCSRRGTEPGEDASICASKCIAKDSANRPEHFDTLVKDNQLGAANNYGTLGSIVRPTVTRVSDVSRFAGERYAVTTMLTIAGGHVKV